MVAIIPGLDEKSHFSSSMSREVETQDESLDFECGSQNPTIILWFFFMQTIINLSFEFHCFSTWNCVSFCVIFLIVILKRLFIPYSYGNFSIFYPIWTMNFAQCLYAKLKLENLCQSSYEKCLFYSANQNLSRYENIIHRWWSFPQ